jgi:hypothetical protein
VDVKVSGARRKLKLSLMEARATMEEVREREVAKIRKSEIEW